jgi:hypothetical protein
MSGFARRLEAIPWRSIAGDPRPSPARSWWRRPSTPSTSSTTTSARSPSCGGQHAAGNKPGERRGGDGQAERTSRASTAMGSP